MHVTAQDNRTDRPAPIGLLDRWRNRRLARRNATALRFSPHLLRDIGAPGHIAAAPRPRHYPGGLWRRSGHPLVRARRR